MGKMYRLIILMGVLFMPYTLSAENLPVEVKLDSLTTAVTEQVQIVDPVQPFRYGVGFQGTFPAWGISGTMMFTDEITGQLILGPFGYLQTYAARGLYQFRDETYWDLYGFGMLGLWTYNYGFNRQSTESSLGLGAGAGIQYDWRAWNDELPPIYWNVELGLGYVNLDRYNFGSVLFGTGVHYRF